jgi:cysteinyl-tRNA synthetase
MQKACGPVALLGSGETSLAEERHQAHLRQDWVTADIFRQKITRLGCLVLDTPEEQKFVRQP